MCHRNLKNEGTVGRCIKHYYRHQKPRKYRNITCKFNTSVCNTNLDNEETQSTFNTIIIYIYVTQTWIMKKQKVHSKLLYVTETWIMKKEKAHSTQLYVTLTWIMKK